MQTTYKNNQLSQVAAQVSQLLQGGASTSTAAPYDKQSFLNEVFMGTDEYDQLSGLLLAKKNLILQGPPGVGKTFAARRLAWAIQGSKDDSRIKIVQFHQSYCYEDFVGGFRPTATGFEAAAGVFLEFCMKAMLSPTEKFFFIIDEINRGNLSKIFGELLMLIEDDKRGTALDHKYTAVLPVAKSLTDQGASNYAGTFFVPENIYIIGMMNTADRSIALMDYALRRRFAFYEIRPAFANSTFKAIAQSQNAQKLIGVIEQLNQTIENDFGSGFCIGHSYFSKAGLTADDLKRIVMFEIYPVLQEYWFEDDSKPSKAETWRDALLQYCV